MTTPRTDAGMLVDLAYGRTGVTVEFPTERTTVVQPRYVPAVSDPLARDSLRDPVAGPPLREIVQPRQTGAISGATAPVLNSDT